ncbi:dnaJ homolog subfamily B member 13 isoform X4 [Triplophysa rosa]|uniref:dnaJ homolog subfamily B member 13 isoform X4 n=1 Tax=Triplophysa rosa TaxID=992332 RepID=UPI002545C69C|nr:dnaJ homolog subfamily B member 13 isoform X4 [Triplophysa rosa]
MGRDYYAVLEINRNATDTDINKAYRRLALKHHPRGSSHACSAERFILLAEAFDVLSDPRKKATYDKFEEEGLKGGIPSELGASGAWSSGYTYHGNAEETFRQFFGGDNPFADFFTTDGSEVNTGLSTLRGQKEKIQDPPIERDLHLALEDLYYGCTKKIKISRRGPNNIPADIVFVIRQKHHPRFVRQNDDLYYTAHISLEKALTGFSVEVETLDSRLLNIPINDTVHPQYNKVVTGEGMPLASSPSRRGDLIIRFITHFPEKLSAKKQQLLKQALTDPIINI